jgi:hypothetical protein
VRRRYWLRRSLVLLVVTAVVGTGAGAFAVEMQDARADAVEASGWALATRVERIRLGTVLERTQADLDRTWDQRTLRRAERTEAERRLEALYARLVGLNEELTELVASSALHVLHLDATKRCLLGVERAIEHAAVDDTRGAVATLGSVTDACARAQQAGQTS